MRNSRNGFIVSLLIAVIALVLGGGIFLYIKNKEASQASILENVQNINSVSVPTANISAPAQITENGSFETYKNIKKGYEISYPVDAKIDTSDLSCIRIITKQFGTVYINATSGNPCGEPTGIGTGMIRVDENVTIANKQYSARGYREKDNSYSFLSFGLTPDDKIFVTYGVDHSDQSNPKSWNMLGSLTDSEYQSALNSAKEIIFTLK